MAASAKYPSVLFLIFLISFAPIQARESKFFSKFTFHQHLTPTRSNTVAPVPSSNDGQFPPTSAPAFPPDTNALAPITVAFPPDNYADIPAPALAPEPFPSTPDKTSNEEYNTGESYHSEELNTGYSKNREDSFNNAASYNNREDSFNNNWHGRKQQGMSDTRFMEHGRYFYDVDKENYRGNEYTTSAARTGEFNRDNTGEYGAREFELSDNGLFGENGNKKNYENSDRIGGNWPETEKQGMSDTRAMENGRYFHDLNAEENFYRNGYKDMSQSHGEFGSSRGVDSRNKYDGGNYFGNNEANEDEFGKSVEEESQYQVENKEEYQP